jgi:hypothetical protein
MAQSRTVRGAGFSQNDESPGDSPAWASPFLRETELLGLLDAALREEVLTPFFVRQLTALIVQAEQPA